MRSLTVPGVNDRRLDLTVSTFGHAQSATTSVRGTVTDAKGALVGAAVMLENKETGFSCNRKKMIRGSISSWKCRRRPMSLPCR